MVQFTVMFKPMLMEIASVAFAALVVFAPDSCLAATFAKVSASRGANKNYVTVKWNGVKGAKGYSILRGVKKDTWKRATNT